MVDLSIAMLNYQRVVLMAHMGSHGNGIENGQTSSHGGLLEVADLANALRSPCHGWPENPKKHWFWGFSAKKKPQLWDFPTISYGFSHHFPKKTCNKTIGIGKWWENPSFSNSYDFFAYFFASCSRAALQHLQLPWLGPWGSGNLLLSLSLVLVVSRQGEDGCNFRGSIKRGKLENLGKVMKFP